MRKILIGIAVVLIIVSLPHALEDFHYGDLLRFGISLPVGVVGLVMSYAAELVGIALVVRGSLRGALLLALLGAIWCAGAIIIHGRDLLYAGPEYRHGFISKLFEVLVIVLGASLAAIGVGVAAMQPPKQPADNAAQIVGRFQR